MTASRIERIVAAYEANSDAAWVWHLVRHIERDTGRELGVDHQVGFSAGVHDHRDAVRRGRLPITTPATSGLSWRTEFFRELLPIPLRARGQDSHLKLVSMAFGQGFVLDEILRVSHQR